MKSPWLQLLLLLLYLLLVLMVAKIFDFVLWYQHGMVSTQLLDPLMLSVRQLKLLLDSRGVSYAEFYEKPELVRLLENSGDITLGEIDHVQDTVMPLKDLQKSTPATSYFSGGAHFYEEVEDTRDGVWLVQVITSSKPLLDDPGWKMVCRKLEPFGIRTGVFDCRRDPSHCEKKGWKQPLLLLAMPKGKKPKDKVVVQPFTSNKPKAVVDWVRHQLSSWVKTIHSIDEVNNEWLTINISDAKENIKRSGNSASNSVSSNSVRVLLLTQLLQPPLFLAALSIKFTGRVRFGMFSVKKEEIDHVQKLLKFPTRKLPCYLVITPEKTVVYGHQRLEFFNLWSMNAFLRGIQPEMNDVFLSSLILVNMLVSISVFMVSAQFWLKWAVNCLWILVSYNLWLFSAWLLILAAGHSTMYDVIVDWLLTFFRVVGLSSCGSVIRTEWALQFYHPPLFIGSFACYLILVKWVLQTWAPLWIQPSDSESEREVRAWWEVLPVDSYWFNYLFRPIASLARPVPQPLAELEEGLDMLIERLAVPNLWLQPVIAVDYIKDLPLWQYRGWNVGDEFSSSSGSTNCLHSASPKLLERVMDGEEPKDLISCRCKTSQDQARLRSCSSAKSGTLGLKVNGSPDCSCPCTRLSTTTSSNKTQDAAKSSHLCLDSCVSCKGQHYCENKHVRCTSERESCASRDESNNSTSENELEECDIDIGWKAPEGVLPTTDCAVCLEGYRYGTILCALPCGHNYHQRCILAWLQRDNHHCPVCRWPAYRSRSIYIHPHRE